MTLDPRLAEIKLDPFGDRPRFYPPGAHPALYRLRRHQDSLRLLPPSRERGECLTYIADLIAAFEERESELKQQYLRMAER